MRRPKPRCLVRVQVGARRDAGVVDEIPGAYKSLESVIEAQTDLVEVVARPHTLMCVKG